MPVVIDGVISATGAVLAAAICPQAKDYMLASHVSKEPAGELILKASWQRTPCAPFTATCAWAKEPEL